MTIDYSKTIHLPKTSFPARGGLPQKEPEILKRWEDMNLYERQREVSKGRKKFILHMGPPFANGNIHMGHVLSTTLKDVVCRSYQMLGFDSPLVPGFDCHGLPIESKIEEGFREKNRKKEDMPVVEFREECRNYAATWVGVQSSEFKRLGILGDWKNPYLTMTNESEGRIASEIHKFLQNGGLYRGSKPVMWSVAEGTALAEAEIEYKDHTSDTVYVKFPVKKSPKKEFEGAHIVIWTTTPWTLPGNRAIAYGEDLDYVGVETPAGKLFIIAPRLETFLKENAIEESKVFWVGKGSAFAGVVCHHPLHGKGYDFDVPLLVGDFVTTDVGTGFVHCAPGHGEDDYRLCLKHKLEIPETVLGNGQYAPHVPLFAGAPVMMPDGKRGPGNKFVMNAIEETGNLMARAQIRHSYPHSWRSKTPVIFRNTPQWFISMEKNALREKAIAEIAKTRFVPSGGQKRIGSMIEGRGDWCVSRQRSWGVPIAIFVNKKTGEPLGDEKVLTRIIDILKKEGADAWYSRTPADFLGADYNPGDFEQIRDIIDVWFESGSTQGFVLEARADLGRPVDLYLEGSDQHRGWFQSSLLVGVGTRGNAPYRQILTHGFILDEKGYKMSKSQGNVTSPTKLMEQFGADILRLWVVHSDYTQDIRFGLGILDSLSDVYRRIRNTFCYLLGNLNGFDKKHKVAYKDLADFDRWVLHRLSVVDKTVRQSIEDYDFMQMITVLHDFCNKDLSAFYFDINKDNLYCNGEGSLERNATLTVLDEVFTYLCHWLSPVLAFTCEEAWLSYKGLDLSNKTESIHLSVLPQVPAEWNSAQLAGAFEKIYDVRRAITGALELKRAEKVIGKSLEAAPKVYVEDAALRAVLEKTALADMAITSQVALMSGAAPAGAFVLDDVKGVGVVVEKALGDKCERCWKILPEVGSDAEHKTLCARCADVVRKKLKEAA